MPAGSARRLFFRLISLGLLSSCALQSLASQRYHMTALDFIPSGLSDSGWVTGYANGTYFRWSEATGLDVVGVTPSSLDQRPVVNNQGLVAGSRRAASGKQTAFLWTSATGVWDFLGEHDRVVISALNNLGDIVGWYRDGNSDVAFFRSGQGEVQALSFSGEDLNDLGIASGIGFIPALGVSTAARGNATDFELMPLPESTYDFVLESPAINRDGTVCGSFTRNFGEYGSFRWNSDGSIDWFETENYSWLYGLMAINDDGVMLADGIGGTLLVEPTMSYSALDDSYDASSQGWHSYYANLLNNRGQVAGYGRSPDGRVVGYLATPVPEPTTLSVFGFAALLVLSFRHFRLRYRQRSDPDWSS